MIAECGTTTVSSRLLHVADFGHPGADYLPFRLLINTVDVKESLSLSGGDPAYPNLLHSWSQDKDSHIWQ